MGVQIPPLLPTDIQGRILCWCPISNPLLGCGLIVDFFLFNIVNSIVIFQYINHMKTDNPDEIMLNPEYLKKIQDSEEKQSDEIPQDMKDYVDELMENPLNQVDCSVMKYILDYLSDPMNSSIYRDQVIFKNQSNIDEQNDESESEEFRVTIPIFSTKF